MPAAAAQAYVAWVSRHLSDDGFFISHNADRVKNQPDVVQRHSEYGYQQFHFEAVYPNTAAGGPLHIQHLILVLSKSRGLQPDFDWAVLDRLGWLLNLGLNHEVEKVCNFVNTPGDKLGEIFLDIVERFYRASTLPEKYAVASTRTGDAACDLILEFLQGGAAFLQNDPTAYGHLFKYLSASRSPMAIALGLLTVRLWSGGAFDAAQQQVVIDAWAKVPVYVREQLDGLRLAAAQVRFATYMRLM